MQIFAKITVLGFETFFDSKIEMLAKKLKVLKLKLKL